MGDIILTCDFRQDFAERDFLNQHFPGARQKINRIFCAETFFLSLSNRFFIFAAFDEFKRPAPPGD